MDLSWLLLRISLRAKKGMIKLAEGYNLTAIQAFTVCLLEPGKSVPMNSISNVLVCDASHVTGIVDKLVANAFIERKESDEDRRVHTITLTKKGAKVRESLLQKITSDYLPNVTKLSAKEKEICKTLLEKILG